MLIGTGSVSESAPQVRFIKETGAAAGIAALAEPVLESLGFRLVLARIMGGASPIVEIMAERPDGSMSIDDCEAVSRNLSPLLDVHDPLPTAYRLQISSPGIDRPLVRPQDFDTWAGYEAKIELKEMIDGRRRFRGLLEGLEDGEIRIEVDLGKAGHQVLGLPIGLVAEARLVLTEDLVREALRRGKAAERGSSSGSDGESAGQQQAIPSADDTGRERRGRGLEPRKARPRHPKATGGPSAAAKQSDKP